MSFSPRGYHKKRLKQQVAGVEEKKDFSFPPSPFEDLKPMIKQRNFESYYTEFDPANPEDYKVSDFHEYASYFSKQ